MHKAYCIFFEDTPRKSQYNYTQKGQFHLYDYLLV